MTARMLLAAFLFAATWATLMFLWSDDHSIAKAVSYAMTGLGVGAVWAWRMKKLGLFRS